MQTAPEITINDSPITLLRTGRRRWFAKIDGVPSATLLKEHAALIDDYFKACFARSTVGRRLHSTGNPYALVALGGYGRAEQCVFSDIDLLILFAGRVPPAAEELVRQMIYPLWDMGLEVGQATRSINESLRLARQDYEVLTALLDSRFICGREELFEQLMQRLREKLLAVKRNRIVNWLVATNQARHERFGDSAYLLEPNLKEGQGGLRDYHTMLWIGCILVGVKQARDLEYLGFLSHNEFQALNAALGFVWRVRNQLHLLMNRKCDQLYLETQAKLAEALGVKGGINLLPVEKLLGALHHHMEFIKQTYRVFIYELEQKRRLRLKSHRLKKTPVAGLKFNRGMLNFVTAEAIVRDPHLLIGIFTESVRHKAPLNAEARRLVRDFGHLVADPRFRNAPTTVAAFEKILMRSSAPFDALNAMLATGFLVRFIPAFKDVVDRIQFDQYHLYPVARHLLLTVRKLKEIVADRSTTEDLFAQRLYHEIRTKRALFWAALLHDIGKGDPAPAHAERGARLAETILADKGLAPRDIALVVFLVKEHLLLFETATRRDINEEETALFVARRVGQANRLKMLYLLSVADAMATGPKAWNDWTASLMRSLFLSTLNALEHGELVSRRALKTMEEKQERILAAVTDAPAREHYRQLLAVLSPRYLLFAAAQDIARHLALYDRLKAAPLAFEVDKSADGRTRTLTVCVKDRPGLLAKLAGTLTLNNINILGVHIFTWRNGVALDLFEVQAPPDPIFEDERWQRFAADLTAALDGDLDLSAELARKRNNFKSIRPFTRQQPQRVVIDNESSSFFTIVEVIAWDYPGLLYRITDALFRCRLDIWVAKIATRVDQVVDVFYVRNLDGEKIDRPEEVAAVQAAVQQVLGLDAKPGRRR